VQRPLVKEYTLPEVEQLAADTNLKPGAAIGQRLFQEARCAECHRLGDTGAAVGPDLTTIGRRFSLHDLAQTLVDPNFTISDQYQQTEFVVDGVKYVGRITDLVRDEIKISTDISDPKSQVEFKRADVEEQRPSKVSPMPAGLLNTLTAEEVGQLMAFLRENR
jgi:putative heme-binding domain-containing protein